MLDVLKVGDKEFLEFKVTAEKTVPFLYPESPEFQEIPQIFATGYMVGLMEWCCMRSISKALEKGEGSLGTLIQISHLAPTLPNSTVKVEATIVKIDGRKVVWQVLAKDETDTIGEGLIGRSVVMWNRFEKILANKKSAILKLNR